MCHRCQACWCCYEAVYVDEREVDFMLVKTLSLQLLEPPASEDDQAWKDWKLKELLGVEAPRSAEGWPRCLSLLTARNTWFWP